jgi:acyl-CoA thioesterase I
MRQRRRRTLRADRRRAWLARGAAALAAVCAGVAVAQSPAKPTDAEVCLDANTSLSLGAALPRVAARLKADEPLRIVAIGSSSTAGLWVVSRAATYPEVMRRELSRLWPNARVEVVNSGRIGETIRGSIARFDRDVLAYAPGLVVWQLGTNDVAWGRRADGLKDRVLAGVRKLKAAGVDVILMDLQYAPLVLVSSQHGIMETIIAEVAREEACFPASSSCGARSTRAYPGARSSRGTACTIPPPVTTVSAARSPVPLRPPAAEATRVPTG